VKPLTPTQRAYLSDLERGADMRVWNGTHFIRTRRILERAGLVKHNVSPGHGGPRWVITDAGRAAVSAFATGAAG
jgi:hypothetical protein